jgi:hypothetical protein
VLHVLLKDCPLRRLVWGVVQPDHQLILLKIRSVQVIPVGRRSPGKVLPLRFGCKERDRLSREVDVIGFRFFRVKSEHVKMRRLCVQQCAAGKQQNAQERYNPPLHA